MAGTVALLLWHNSVWLTGALRQATAANQALRHARQQVADQAAQLQASRDRVCRRRGRRTTPHPARPARRSATVPARRRCHRAAGPPALGHQPRPHRRTPRPAPRRPGPGGHRPAPPGPRHLPPDADRPRPARRAHRRRCPLPATGHRPRRHHRPLPARGGSSDLLLLPGSAAKRRQARRRPRPHHRHPAPRHQRAGLRDHRRRPRPHQHQHRTGAGLANMVDRIAAVGGQLRIDSAPGRGTTIRATVPTLRPHDPGTDDQPGM